MCKVYSIYEVKDMKRVKSELEGFFNHTPKFGKAVMFWKRYILIDNYRLTLFASSGGEMFYTTEKFILRFIELEESGLVKLYRIISEMSNIVKNYDKNAYLLTINLKKKRDDFFLMTFYSRIPYSCCNKNVYYVYYLKKPLPNKGFEVVTDYLFLGVNKEMEIKKIVNGFKFKKALSKSASSISWGVPDENLSSSAEYFILLKDYLNNYRIKDLQEYLFNPPFNNVHPYISVNTLFLNTFQHLTTRMNISRGKIEFSIKRGRKIMPVTHEVSNIKTLEHKLREIDKPRLFNELVYATRTFTYKIIVGKLIKYFNRTYMKNIKYSDYWTYPHEKITEPLEDLFKFTLLYTSFTSYYGLLNGSINDYYEKLFDTISDVRMFSLSGKGDEGKYYFPVLTRFKLNRTGDTYYIANLPNTFTLMAYLTELYNANQTHTSSIGKPFVVPIVNGDDVELVDLRNDCGVNGKDFLDSVFGTANIGSYDEYYVYNANPEKKDIKVSVVGRKVTDSLDICEIVKYLPIPGLFIKMDDAVIGVGQLLHKEGEPGRGVFMFTRDPSKHLITSVDTEVFKLGKHAYSEKYKEGVRQLLGLF